MTDAVDFRLERVGVTKNARLESILIVPPAEVISPAQQGSRTCPSIQALHTRNQTRIVEVHIFVADAQGNDDEFSTGNQNPCRLKNHGRVVIPFKAIERAKGNEVRHRSAFDGNGTRRSANSKTVATRLVFQVYIQDAAPETSSDHRSPKTGLGTYVDDDAGSIEPAKLCADIMPQRISNPSLSKIVKTGIVHLTLESGQDFMGDR